VGSYYRLKEIGYQLPAGCHIVPREMTQPLEEATRIVEDAEATAKEIVAAAEEAYRRECARGYEDGLEKARLADIERLLGETGTLDAALRDVEDDLIRIVISAVRKLTQEFDDIRKAEAVVRNALGQMRREKKAELRVAPGQYNEFREAISGIAGDFPEIDLVDVVEDASLAPPQVIVETSIGRVEGEFGRSLDELEAIILRLTTRRERDQPIVQSTVEP
jgi:type III secretion protein L